MIEEGSDYESFLLRLYLAEGARTPVCRATLQSTKTGERVGFATLWDAFAFLEERMGLGCPDPPGPPASRRLFHVPLSI